MIILNLDQILTAIDRRLEEISDIRSRLLDDDIPDWEDGEVAWEEARIRVQISAGMEKGHIDRAIKSFIKVGKELKVI